MPQHSFCGEGRLMTDGVMARVGCRPEAAISIIDRHLASRLSIVLVAVVTLSGCVSGEPMWTAEAVAIPGAMPSEQWSAAFYLADPIKFARSSHVKDCNDYAAENFARLRAEGLAPHFVMAITESGIGHMVVSVERNGTTLIYDNRLPQPGIPIDWRMLPYRWVAREGDDGIWYAVGTDGGTALPANPAPNGAPL
jgi:hypothetical protein